MCCERVHYPDSVGLHELTEEHHHIILPWSDTVAICLAAHARDLSVIWRDFNKESFKMSVATVKSLRHLLPYLPPEPTSEQMAAWNAVYDFNRETGDLISVAVAEGGRLSLAWLRDTLEAWRPDGLWSVTGREQFTIEPPEPLDYHEWLAWQAKKEQEAKELLSAGGVGG